MIRANARKSVLAELGRHSSLLPGAAEVLADRWASMFDNARPDVIADYVSRHLTDEAVVRLSHDPGLRPDTAGKSPLRIALERHSDGLRPGAVDALVETWSDETLSLDEHQIAGFVARRLADPKARSYLIEEAVAVHTLPQPPCRDTSGSFGLTPSNDPGLRTWSSSARHS